MIKLFCFICHANDESHKRKLVCETDNNDIDIWHATS